jgi:hypothetical protein
MQKLFNAGQILCIYWSFGVSFNCSQYFLKLDQISFFFSD